MKRRMFSVLLVMLLAISLVAVSAAAAETDGQKALVEEGKRIAKAAKAMTFPTDATSYEADCPIHGKVTWTPLTPEGAFTMVKDSHYYLTASVTNSTVSFTAPNNSANTTCLHLNGKSITNTAGSVLIGKAGQMYVMGEGQITGGTTGVNAGAAASISCGTAAGQINLYSGTYSKYNSANTSNVLCVGYNGGVINLYADALVQGGTGGSAVYMRYNTAYTNAIFNMYGGTIDATNSTEVAVDMEAVTNGKRDMTFNMYAGTIKNGNGTNGGNVIVRDGDVFNLYGGQIENGTATNGGNIYVDTGATFNMYGGTVCGSRDEGGNAIGGVAEAGGNVYLGSSTVFSMTGGTIKDGTATVSGGGNIFAKGETDAWVDMQLKNATVSGGFAINSTHGGNIALTRAELTVEDGTVIEKGEAHGGRGGNLRVYQSNVYMTGGKINGGNATSKFSNGGSDSIWLQGGGNSSLGVMYMLGGTVTGIDDRAGSAITVHGNGALYLGGNATVTDTNAKYADVFTSGKVYICDGWSGSADIDFYSGSTVVDMHVGDVIDTGKLSVVTLDADYNATLGGSFTGRLFHHSTGAQILGKADGSAVIGGIALVDANGKQTMATDPMTQWATGAYAYIKLYNPYTITDPANELWVDLSGFDLTLSGSGKINVFDSANDTYKASACGAITNNGTVEVAQDVVAPNGNRYVAVTEEGVTTMHRLHIEMKAVSLRVTEAGIYYKAAYDCDTLLAGKVSAYGVVLSLADMPGADFTSAKEFMDRNRYTMGAEPFTSGMTATSGSVFGIMKDSREASVNAQYGELKIYANPYILLELQEPAFFVGDNDNAGKKADAAGFDGTAFSLHDVMDAIDNIYFDYNAATRKTIDQFYAAWMDKGMADWSFVNIGTQATRVDNSPLQFAEGSTQAQCPVCKTDVTWTPFSQSEDTTAKIGTPAAGTHYYLTEDITYTGSSAGFIAAPINQNETACLHLNGHNLTATAYTAIHSPYASAGILNVMGEGTVSGNRSGTGTTIYLSSQSAEGRLNLYGGTYVQPVSNTSSMTAIINGGSIHVYDDAWLKGSGSNNTAYMDLASNAAATFAVHGGKVTDGELAVAQSDSKNTRTILVDGRSYVEQMTIRNAKITVEIAGAPTIDYLAMTSGTKLTVGTLVKGAKIGISAQNGAFTNAFANAGAYADYFFAWNEPDSISVTDAGELSYDINYEHYMTSYQRDVKAEAIADGKIHYYFMAAKGMVMSPTNGGDIDKWGDSCLVVFPNGETMLIDSGYAVQAPVIIGSLKRMGVTNLDYLVITHPHNDHMGGAFSSSSTFLDEITVEQVYYQDLAYTDNGWIGVVESKCDARNIPYEAIWTGDVITIGESDLAVTMTMLWPGEDADLTIDSAENNNSMVFRFDYGAHSSLFTADIYTATETKLRELYTNGELDVDMMKVPHHGLALSSSSLAFLQAVTPEIAVATGSFDINDTINTRYTSTDASKGVGATLLEDRFHGYIHISSGTDGVMTTETETQ